MEVKLEKLLVAFATQYAALNAIANTGMVTPKDIELITLLNNSVENELMNEVNIGMTMINNIPDKEGDE